MPRYNLEEQVEEELYYDNDTTPPESPKTPEQEKDEIMLIDKFHRDAVLCFEKLESFVAKNNPLLMNKCDIKDFMKLITR